MNHVRVCDKTPSTNCGESGQWCMRCWIDYNLADGEAPVKSCVQCGIVHLKERMFEKLEGWLCRECALKYDVELLAKMASSQ